MSSEKVKFRTRSAPKRILADSETSNPYYTEWYLEITPESNKCPHCGEEFIITQYCPSCRHANRLSTITVSPSINTIRKVLLNIIVHNGDLRERTDEKEQLLRTIEFLSTIQKAICVFVERTYGYKIKRAKLL